MVGGWENSFDPVSELVSSDAVLGVEPEETEDSDWSRWELRPLARAMTAYW